MVFKQMALFSLYLFVKWNNWKINNFPFIYPINLPLILTTKNPTKFIKEFILFKTFWPNKWKSWSKLVDEANASFEYAKFLTFTYFSHKRQRWKGRNKIRIRRRLSQWKIWVFSRLNIKTTIKTLLFDIWRWFNGFRWWSSASRYKSTKRKTKQNFPKENRINEKIGKDKIKRTFACRKESKIRAKSWGLWNDVQGLTTQKKWYSILRMSIFQLFSIN